MDNYLRMLERRAATGDIEASLRLAREKDRNNPLLPCIEISYDPDVTDFINTDYMWVYSWRCDIYVAAKINTDNPDLLLKADTAAYIGRITRGLSAWHSFSRRIIWYAYAQITYSRWRI